MAYIWAMARPQLRKEVQRAVRRSDPVIGLGELVRSHDARVVLRCLASLQDGQFATQQTAALGLTLSAVRWLRASGEVESLCRGVWRFRSAPEAPDSSVTAWLRCWPKAVISHHDAAAFHHLPTGRRVTPHPHVTVAHGAQCAPVGVEVHVSRCLTGADIYWNAGVPYTSLARTVCDLADPDAPWETFTRVDDAIALGAKQAWLHERASTLTAGRGGAKLVRDVTDPASAAVFRSWLERTAAHVYRAGHLPDPEWNVEIRDGGGRIGIVDALWRPERVISEKEGLRFHTTPAQRRSDAERFNRLLDAQYAARRFTWLDVVERPVYVVTTVARALQAAGANVDLAAIPRDIAIPDAPFRSRR